MPERLKGLVPSDRELPLKPAPWTQEEVDALHELAQNYLWQERFRKKSVKWIVLILGIPAALVYFFEPLERLIRIIRALMGAKF